MAGKEGKNVKVRCHKPPGVAWDRVDASLDRASSSGEPVPVSALWTALWGGCNPGV